MDILSGEDHIIKMLFHFDDYEDEELILALLNITSEEYNQTIAKYKGYGQKNLCANIIEESEIFYQCLDCSRSTYHAICRECFIPEIHKNHAVFYGQIDSKTPGYCDCGDTQIFDNNSMCPKHIPVQLKFDNKQLDNIVAKKYEQFLIIAFGLLQKGLEKIISYPADLVDNLENIVESFNNELLKNYFNLHKIHFQTIKNSMNKTKKIHRLIMRCLEIITTENVVWGYLTGTILKQEYNSQNSSNVRGSTSLLEQYIKYDAYLEGSLKFEQDISTFFPILFQDDEFREYLIRIVIQNLHNQYLIVYSYKLITINNTEFNFQMYSTINDQILDDLFEKIQICRQIKQSQCEKVILSSIISQKSYLFISRGYIEILKLHKNIGTSIYDNIFNGISNLFLEIPLTNQNSLELTNSICYIFELISSCKQGLTELVNQIQEIISTDSLFYSQILSPNQLEFHKLLYKSLLVQSLTRRYPYQQRNDFNLQSQTEEMEEQSLNYFQIISIKILSQFRSDLKLMLLALGHSNSYQVKNLQKIILHYFLNSLVPCFNQKHKSPLQLIMSNVVLSDRSFITVLSMYLISFSNSKEAYHDILQISGLKIEKFRLTMYHILKRAILNYTIFSDHEYYIGKQDVMQDLDEEVSLQQVDCAYIQIYAFLFQEWGIHDIIQCYNQIASYFKREGNLALLICRIVQTDNDLIQCVGNILGNELNNQFQKGVNKLFQTIFYSQTFYQLNELKNILREFTNENYQGFQTLILSCCEKNQDNGQFQLKTELKLPIYEPVYAFQSKQIQENINDKLQMQNDKFAELFGSSLEHELQYFKTDKSTLTKFRFEILKAISLDDQQYLLGKILKDLETTFQSNSKFDIIVGQSIKNLQDNAIYINLLILANQFFRTRNVIIYTRLVKIQHYCKIILSSEKINQTQKFFFQTYCSRIENKSMPQKMNQTDNKQQSTSEKNQQFKQKLKLKYIQMKVNFSSKVDDDLFAKDTDEKCFFCQLPFIQEDIQYQPILIQYSNIYQYLNIFQAQDILSVHVSNCNHIFHFKCLKTKILQARDLNYWQCPLCHTLFNFMLPNSIKNDKKARKHFYYSIQNLYHSIRTNYQSYDQEFANYTFLEQILTQILFNLTFQLLNDLETFYQRNQHIVIQKIIDTMRILYQEKEINLIENIKQSETEIVFQIFNLIQTHLIKEHDSNAFQEKLSRLLNPNFELATSLSAALSQRKFNTQINHRLLPYDIQKIKNLFKQEQLNFLTNNFSSFLGQNYLTPCQQKKCKFPQQLEAKFKGQYICLICFKKMCPKYCIKPKKSKLGNLQRHSEKKHCCKSIFLNAQGSEIILMFSPYYIFMPNTLFTDQLGDTPIKGPYPLEHYKKFEINMKSLDQLFQIVMDQKYLTKIYENSNNVQIQEI